MVRQCGIRPGSNKGDLRRQAAASAAGAGFTPRMRGALRYARANKILHHL